MNLSKLGGAVLAGLFLTAQLACGRAASARQDTTKPGDPARAARAAEYPNLRKQAEALAQAFDRGEFDKVVSLTYPELVRLMGGPRAMSSMLDQEMREAAAVQVKLLSTTVGDPEPATRIRERLYAIVPTRLRMQFAGGVATQESFMIGVSDDGGESWTFVDGSGGKSEAQMRALLPEAAGKLKLPEPQPPVIEREP